MRAAKFIRVGCAVIFLGGLAGIIASSIAGNNEGFVVTFGSITAVAALVLIAVSAVTNRTQIDVFADADAERLESQIVAVIEQGADEAAVRALVREALNIGKR